MEGDHRTIQTIALAATPNLDNDRPIMADTMTENSITPEK